LMGDFDAVIDATGSYGNHNYFGRGGIPALGERALQNAICYTIPNLPALPPLPPSAAAAAAAAAAVVSEAFPVVAAPPDGIFMRNTPSSSSPLTTIVIGSGASAITTLNYLRQEPSNIVWVTRRSGLLYHRVEGDALPQRDALYAFGNSLSASATDSASGSASGSASAAPGSDGSAVRHVGGVDVLRVAKLNSGSVGTVTSVTTTSTTTTTNSGTADTGLAPYRYRLTLRHNDNNEENSTFTVDCHNIVANVGYRPNTEISQELQIHYCYATEAPMKLAASRMAAAGGGGDCLTQVAPGKENLKNPEPRLYVVGMKSYGRDTAFLLRIGYEQVRQVMLLLGEDFAE